MKDAVHLFCINIIWFLSCRELDDNLLTNIPTALTKLTLLQELSVSGNKIKYIPEGILQQAPGLTLLELKGNPLVGVHPHAFSSLPNLRKLILSEARELTVFPSLNGTTALEILRLDRASLSYVPSSLCHTCPKLKSLNLGNNLFPELPSRGLDRLLHLKTFNNPNLREFPAPENFPRIQSLVLSYAYHCCAFLPLIPAEPPKPNLHEAVLFPTDNEFDMSLWNNSLTDIWPQLRFLAVVDASTLGEFRMYAIPWQMSAGCQLAGFLGVLSSELSVYTLAVITLERNYAITHAMHLNKRLSLKHAGYIMACGWSFALVMAILPLFGISDYRKFAICLPFETTTGPASLTYVVFLMFINGVAFLILMGCYLKMYCAIRGSQAWNSNDSRIAKRMALLVFTDFICWSPIAFFSLTAAFGLQLISLEQAKVFTVFILPLNSCCNPFLYAILTKQFKKDCVLICKAIEESRVTRGIGRCRHSSNFSNRQTPANTNSLVDRSSREHQHTHPHHVQTCTCSTKLLSDGTPVSSRNRRQRSSARIWLLDKANWILLCLNRDRDSRLRTRSDQYAYQIAEIQQKQHKRASSVSSSENFSSSRSDSWRQNHHHCGIPLRLLDPKRRASSWLVTRKTSQDSNLSSSRNDSSGSATTASTSTWRMSRSSASSDVRTTVVSLPPEPSNPRPRAKPRLTRQSAIVQDDSEPPGSPGRLTVRFLTTIPSAAETSVQQDEESGSPSGCTAAVLHTNELSSHSQPYYAILHTSSSPQGSPAGGSPALQHITIHTSPHTTLDTGPQRRISRAGLPTQQPCPSPFLSSHRQQPTTSQSSPQLCCLTSEPQNSCAEHQTSHPPSPAASTPQQQRTPSPSQRQARHQDNT
ncbi:hypothetical protein C0J52_02861 [Blattella germanica]|nr:hypothetical protein C0J52_02861 [Blattella germanica]